MMRYFSLSLLALVLPFAATAQTPDYGSAFGDVWYDGNAEMASYDLTYPRYGQLRQGTAVAITVTEPFDPQQRVKADAAGPDTFNVIKLNLAEDFPTGIYDYNLMTSTFVALAPAHGLPPGSATKVSFTAQEWCGHVYAQALFSKAQGRTAGVTQTSHSYFSGEADQQLSLAGPPENANGLAEDALILWARGLAGPRVEPGNSVDVALYRSLAIQRLTHKPAAWDTATLTRHAPDVSESVATPIGPVTCEILTAAVKSPLGERTYTFHVELASPHRLIEMHRSDGYHLKFRGSDRLPYWQMHNNGQEKALDQIGL